MRYIITIAAMLMAAFTPALAQDVATEAVLATQTPVKALQLPVEVTARYFITKVYGVLDRRLTKQEMLDASRKAIKLIPEEDEYGLWLESSDGYSVSYSGMTPDVSARAAYGDDDHITDYGFFFLFPYDGGGRDQANAEQAQFSGTLLQEMLDMGLAMDVDPLSDALFEVSGDYQQDLVDVRLIEEHNTDDGSGRFILILTVNPDNPDAWTAER